MRDGWIKLHRKIMDSAAWKVLNDAQRIVMITIILMANHRENGWVWKGKKYKCKPGEFISSRRSIADSARVGEQSVRSALQRLTGNLEFATMESTKEATKITICNWKEYQLEAAGKQPEGQPQPNQDPTTNKKEKNIKEFSPTSDEVRLSNLLFNLMKKNNPDVKKPNMNTWHREIDLMMRIDKRHPEAIERIIALSQADPFWRTNILSAGKLRSQFDQLSVKLITRDDESGKEEESLPPGFFVPEYNRMTDDEGNKI